MQTEIEMHDHNQSAAAGKFAPVAPPPVEGFEQNFWASCSIPQKSCDGCRLQTVWHRREIHVQTEWNIFSTIISGLLLPSTLIDGHSYVTLCRSPPPRWTMLRFDNVTMFHPVRWTKLRNIIHTTAWTMLRNIWSDGYHDFETFT